MIEGLLTIQCSVKDHMITSVDINSSRPINLCNRFVGSNQSQTLERIPLIYSLCSFAQLFAAQRAMNNQSIKPISNHLTAAQNIIVAIETIREHLIKMITQWPALFSLKNSACNVSAVNESLKQTARQIFNHDGSWQWHTMNTIDLEQLQTTIKTVTHTVNEFVFNYDINDWLSLEYNDLTEWANDTDTLAASVMNQLNEYNWGSVGDTGSVAKFKVSEQLFAEQLSDHQSGLFMAQPTLNNKTYETTTFNRIHHEGLEQAKQHYGSGLMSRYWSKLIDLASQCQLLKQLFNVLSQADDYSMSQGTKVGIVESARGTLAHYVDTTEQLISDYKIVAPTEWNFHPNGIIQTALNTIRADSQSELLNKVHCFIQSIDPCVDYKLEINHA